MLKVKLNDVKSQFFDKSITRTVDKGKKRGLGRVGGYMRKVVRRSIRKIGKKGVHSKPGNPPKSITGDLRNNIFYVFDAFKESVIVGAAKLNQVFWNGAGEPQAGGTVPQVLEEGGQIGQLEVWNEYTQSWSRADLRSKRRLAGKKLRLRYAKIEPRPYIQPGYEVTEPKIAGFMAEAIEKEQQNAGGLMYR